MGGMGPVAMEEGGSGGGGVIQVSFTDMHDFKTLVSLQDAIALNQVEKRAQERSRVWWSHEANRGPHWFHVEDGTQAARTHAAIATNPSLHTPASRSLPHSHTHSISHAHSHTHSQSLPHSQPHSRSHSMSVSSLSKCVSEASSRDSSCHGPMPLSASSSSSLPCPATPATSGPATATATAATPAVAVTIPSPTSGPPLSAARALISSSSTAADLDSSFPPCAASPPLGCCIAASASSPLLSFSITSNTDSSTPTSSSASASTPASSLQPRTSSGSSPSPYRPSASPLRTRPHASSVPSRHSASPLRSSRHSASPLRSRHSASPLRSRPSSSSTSASSRPSSSSSSTTPSLTSIAFGSGAVSSATLKRLIRKGIPPHLRARVWKAVSGAGRKQAVAPVDYYQWLVEQTTGKETDHTLQIDNDLHRTFPGHPRMDTAEGLAALRRVLVAYSFRDTHVGYCQGMNYVAAYLLLVMRSEEDAFWMLATLVENVLYDDCFAEDLFGVHVEQRVLKDLLHRKQPKLAAHLDAIQFEPSLVTTEWFLCVFAKSFPSESLSSSSPLSEWFLCDFAKSFPSEVPAMPCCLFLSNALSPSLPTLFDLSLALFPILPPSSQPHPLHNAVRLCLRTCLASLLHSPSSNHPPLSIFASSSSPSPSAPTCLLCPFPSHPFPSFPHHPSPIASPSHLHHLSPLPHVYHTKLHDAARVGRDVLFNEGANQGARLRGACCALLSPSFSLTMPPPSPLACAAPRHQTTLRVWDVLFNEGAKVLFRVALALFKMNEAELYQAAHVGEAVDVMNEAELYQAAHVGEAVEVLVRSTAQQYDPEVLLQVRDRERATVGLPALCGPVLHHGLVIILPPSPLPLPSLSPPSPPPWPHQVAFDRLGSMLMATIANQRWLQIITPPYS
ncbi:unnamed protein product [Closterium sp. NIES-65]|nr:unnamed protein product [Closterium sp. NIES-65]